MRKSIVVNATVGVALAAVIGACGGSSPSSPTSTSTSTSVSTAAVKSIVATFADGNQQDVTGLPVWTSSNTAFATVDQSGKVTAVKEGGVSIHATFRNVTDSEYHNVTPLLFLKAAGTVAEVPPGFNAVANARIEIVGGSNMGTVVTSDGAGNFSFGTMRGDDYTLKITRDGYQDLTQKVALTRDLSNISLLMYPNPPGGATARCKDKTWSFAGDKGSACTRNGGGAYWVCPGPFCS